MSNPRKQVSPLMQKQDPVAESLPVGECRTRNALPQVQLCTKQANNEKELFKTNSTQPRILHKINQRERKKKREVSKPFFVPGRKGSGTDACKERTKTQNEKEGVLKNTDRSGF